GPSCSSAAASSATAGGSGSGAAWFVDRAKESGLTFAYFNGMSGEFLFPEMLPGGVALLDYDNDGDLDVFFVQGRMLDAAKPPTMRPSRLRRCRSSAGCSETISSSTRTARARRISSTSRNEAASTRTATAWASTR